jgi:hypothetical protein
MDIKHLIHSERAGDGTETAHIDPIPFANVHVLAWAMTLNGAVHKKHVI